MAGVAVVSDSNAYLPKRLAEANGLLMLQQYVNFANGRREHEDEVDLDAFFDEMRSAEELPTTSHPTVEDFCAAYEGLLGSSDAIVSVHSSSQLSGTCEAAAEAAAQLGAEDRVHVVDSQSAGGGLGLIALSAARRAAMGESAERVVEIAEEARAELKMWFAIDTLEFLRRSGRLGAAGAWIGSTLRVKPILTLESGQMRPVERVRTSERAFERLVDYARQRHSSGADAWFVQHVRSPEQAELLIERAREVFETEPVFVSEIGAVVGAHTGPGLLGIGALPARLLT
ncbi:MAG: fatty acid kinase fatty acid binding subunit [Thermoleophilaceae bacterium]|nr:fatty acid kinase fatty acid binding subunit [Thermoleophilaceae bacterium]